MTSAGGHLLQMHLLRPAWAGLRHAWVTHDKDDARSLLTGETVFYAYGPTTRNLVNLCRNVVVAFRLLRRLRPAAVVTTGAGIAVPFAWLARLYGAKVVYVESVTRIESPSMTCRLVAPFTHRLYVQWPELAERLAGSRYVGRVVGSS